MNITTENINVLFCTLLKLQVCNTFLAVIRVKENQNYTEINNWIADVTLNITLNLLIECYIKYFIFHLIFAHLI